MTSEELIELLAERPFQPLRLHLDDGRVREIRHPEMAIVADTIVAIGVPREDDPRRATRITHCSIPHIVEVEPPESENPPGGNGKKKPKKGRGR
jgi:hypothetical protein